MFLRRLLLLALVAFSASQLPACHDVTSYTKVGATTKLPDRDRVIVYIEWTSDIDKIGKVCNQPADYGCAVSQELNPGEWKCTVYAQKPSDFNDEPRMAVLGHELTHCLGGIHQ